MKAIKYGAAALLLLSQTTAFSAFAASDYTILKMNDKEIKKSEVALTWNSLFPPGSAPDFDSIEEPIRQNVLRGIISEHLLYNEAVEKKINEDKTLKTQLEDAHRKLVVRYYIDQKTKDMVTDKEIDTAYDTMKDEFKDKEEVRARHILVDSEKEAKTIKKQLDNGKDFEELAKEHSIDPGSKIQGGDLGYFTEDKMVPAFSEAAFKLKEDEISAPVKSDFGWHIIKLEDRRDVEVPPLKDVKDQLHAKLTDEKLNKYVNDLLDKAPVQYFDSKGRAKDLTKTPDNSK